MKLPFVRNTKRNLAAGVLNQGIGLLFPFLNRTLFLWLLGPEYLGLNGLFRSVLGMLSLAELGFDAAIVCSMYKPIAEDDRERVCAYLAFYRTVYRWIGTIVFAVGLCLMPFLHLLVHGEVPPDVNLRVLFLIHLCNSSLSYFLYAYRGPVLGAHHRGDVVMNIRSAVQAVQYVAVFFVLLRTRDYYAYVATTVLFTVAGNLLVLRQSVRLFPGIAPRGVLPAAARRQVLSDVRSIFLHKIGGAISYSADNIVVSAFLGLAAVAVYGNYYYVVLSVAGLAGLLNRSVQAGFGNRIHTESKEANFALFMRMNRLNLAVAGCCAAVMAALFQPFIGVWTKHDPAMMRHALTPVLMVLHFYVNQSRQMLLSFKEAAGIWKQDRWKPLVAGALNLSLNITFIILLPEEYKLDGVIFSTTAAYILVQLPWEYHALFSTYFGLDKGRRYWMGQVHHALAAAILCLAAWWAAEAIPAGGFPGLVIKGLAAVAVAAAISSIVHRRVIRETFSFLRRKS